MQRAHVGSSAARVAKRRAGHIARSFAAAGQWLGLPVILDCDTGADDAIAILMAAASSRCRLLGVTTCQGNTPVANVRRHVPEPRPLLLHYA
eukprot:COSAG02_NODE_3015_length_7550_cov_5.305597_2_plen_92_part_00